MIRTKLCCLPNEYIRFPPVVTTNFIILIISRASYVFKIKIQKEKKNFSSLFESITNYIERRTKTMNEGQKASFIAPTVMH